MLIQKLCLAQAVMGFKKAWGNLLITFLAISMTTKYDLKYNLIGTKLLPLGQSFDYSFWQCNDCFSGQSNARKKEGIGSTSMKLSNNSAPLPKFFISVGHLTWKAWKSCHKHLQVRLSHAHDMLNIPSFLINFSSPSLKFTIFLHLSPVGHVPPRTQ